MKYEKIPKELQKKRGPKGKQTRCGEKRFAPQPLNYPKEVKELIKKDKEEKTLNVQHATVSSKILKKVHPFFKASEDERIEMLKVALINKKGFISHAAIELKIDRTTCSQIIKKSDYLQRVMYEIQEKYFDDIEQKIQQRVMDDSDPKLQLEYIKLLRHHKKMIERGWVAKPEITINTNVYTFGENLIENADIDYEIKEVDEDND